MEFYWFKCVKGKGNLPFRSVKGLKRVNSTGFVNHLNSKCSEFTVVKGLDLGAEPSRKNFVDSPSNQSPVNPD